MKILLVTVAGTSTRFSESIGENCLKCIYYKDDFSESLLYRMIYENKGYDRYIIVGGFMFEKLQTAIQKELQIIRDKIILVKNDKYAEYGSGYSLYKGLQVAFEMGFDELVFAEGDLFVDQDSWNKICIGNQNLITTNQEPIIANKAVAFYFDTVGKIHYIYDTKHQSFCIKDEFVSIYNSGQIWKFVDYEQMRMTFNTMQELDWRGTNLIYIEKYFEKLTAGEYDILPLKRWINCNTISDFEKIERDSYENG